MSRFVLLPALLLLSSCDGKETTVRPSVIIEAKDIPGQKPEPTPEPTPTVEPTPQPTPDPTPTPVIEPTKEPVPTPDPDVVKNFFVKAQGQWLSKCVNNNGSSALPGFKFDQREYVWFRYEYKTGDCNGVSDPADGQPIYWLVESVDTLEDGWIQFHGKCNSPWACQDKKQLVQLKFDGALQVREVKNPEEPILLLSNGPG